MEEEKKIKVLFISSWYPNRVKPTLGNFVQKHAEAVSLFADVRVLHVCFDENLKDKKFEIVSDEINSLKTITIYCKKSGNVLHRLGRYLKAYRKGIKIVREQHYNPDIIHANVIFPVGLVFCFLNAFKKIPYVFTEHWTGYLPGNNEKIGLIRKYFSKRIAEKAAMILPVSENLKNALTGFGLKGNYTVIPNVVDTALFSMVPKKRSVVKNILHISSLDDAQKNVTGILRVIKLLSAKRQDFALQIISDGDQQPFIDYAAELAILNRFVFFRGQKTTGEVVEIIQKSDLLLLFSNYENLPCVIVEAFSCGVPVISTDVGGISEIVTQDKGILVKPKDETALENKLNFMLGNLIQFDSCSMHQYAIEHFSYESVGAQFLRVYKEILKR